jgi:OOP family OmpA-OmpF porin
MSKLGFAPCGVGLLLAVAVATPVVAQETRWYVGAGVGEAKFKSVCDSVPVSCRDHDTAWKLFGGYQFNRNFGAELGYADMGKAKANGIVSGVAVDVNSAVTAWDLVGVGTWPFGQGFGLYGKVGLYRAETKTSGSGALAGFTTAASSKHANSNLTFGLGGRYDFTKVIGARAEWQRYRNVGGGSTAKDDIDVFSVGLLFNF